MEGTPRAPSILGVEGAHASDLDPRIVLAGLGADESVRGGHSRPALPTDVATWLRITALPSDTDDAPNPIELALASAADGQHVAFTVLVHHTDRLGTRLFVSGGHAGPSERIRAQLAPSCDVTLAQPPVIPRQWVGHGVRYRLQAEVGTAARPGRPALFDRLTSVSGDWAVVVAFDHVKQLEVRDAQLSAVRLSQAAAENLSTTRQESTNRQVTTVSAEWTRVQEWTGTILDQLAQGGAEGYWEAAAWAFGSESWTASELVVALRGAVTSLEGRRFMAFDGPVASTGGVPPVSLLTTSEAAGMFSSPKSSSPGLAVRPAPPASRRPDTSAHPIDLGTYWSTSIPATIGLTDLEGHAFVTGTTGSGKTATLHRLLAEAWNTHRVPFLVIDPVKDEYSNVAGLFDGGIQVVTGNELSMNILAAGPGEDPRQHITQVAQAFKGAFTMPSPTPYVVTQLFDQIAMQPGGPAGTELHDVRDAVGVLVESLGYSAEPQSNIRASLLTRLNLLLAPPRAHRFAWPDSSMLDRLFTTPTVVTLADLVDEEERSFVVLLLALATCSRARKREVKRPVEHLLVLEEAHRVLPEVQDAGSDPERGSAKTASAQLLTSMLAEVRSYGQQVIVVDQSPSKVASDVVRNTNLKIVHRTVSAADQQTMAAAVGVPESEASLFGSLGRGQVVISTRQEPAPQTVQIELAETRNPTARARRVPRNSPTWPCCEGRSPEQHYRAWQLAGQAEPLMALFLLGCRVGAGSTGEAARDEVSSGLARLETSIGASAHCLAWAGLRRLLVTERNRGLLPSAIAVDTQLERLFSIWLDESPASVESAKSHAVPTTGKAKICPDCGVACYVRLPAWSWLQTGPRTGLSSLASSQWRQELTGIGEWAKGELIRMHALLGPDGAARVVRCQIYQSVSYYRLGPEIADDLLRRAGIPQKKVGAP